MNQNFIIIDYIDYSYLLRKHYISFPAVPCGKYAIALLCFILEATNIGWMATRRITVSSPFNYHEIVFWIFGITSFLESFHTLVVGNRAFSLSLADGSSLLLGFFFAVILLLRCLFLWELYPVEEQHVLALELIYDTAFSYDILSM